MEVVMGEERAWNSSGPWLGKYPSHPQGGLTCPFICTQEVLPG